MPQLGKSTQTSLSEINMVPFIDIVLVLLIIFMITAPILQSGIEVDVPKTHSVKEITEQRLVVSIDKAQKVYLGNEPVNVHQLGAKVKSQLKKPQDAVFLRCDEKNPEGNFLVAPQEHRILRLLELRFHFGAELMDVNRLITEVNLLRFVDAHHQALLGDFLDAVRLRDVHLDAGLQNRSGDHENDQQHQHDVDERHHVDFRERSLRRFAELRHVRSPSINTALLAEGFFDLRGNFQREGVQPLSQVFNILQELVVENNRRDCCCKSRGGGQQSFGDARRHGTKARRAGVSQPGERVDDAPDGAEQADERSDRAGGRQPGHAFFHAAYFFGRRHLHVCRDRREALQFWRMRIARLAADLALQFAISRSVDRSEGRASGGKRLWIGNAARGAEDAQKLIALAADAAE